MTTRFCPECGQPLNVARTEPDRRTAASWRSTFLVTVGLFLAVTSGAGAWHLKEESRNRNGTICQDSGVQTDCVAAATPLARQFAEQFLTGGGLATRVVDRDFGGDLRYLAIGLIGVGVGLGAALFRRTRPGRVGLGGSLLLAVEGLFTVFYGQILLLGAYLLIAVSPTAAPLTLGVIGDSVFRALSRVFLLVGVQ